MSAAIRLNAKKKNRKRTANKFICPLNEYPFIIVLFLLNDFDDDVGNAAGRPAVVECSHGDHDVVKRFLFKHKTDELKDTQLI